MRATWGDLVTPIANYDADPFTSNALVRYFHDIGGRAARSATRQEVGSRTCNL